MRSIPAFISEGKYEVILSAPNRKLEPIILRPLRSELPALWSDISNAMRGLKEHMLLMILLYEVLELERYSFSIKSKRKPGIDDNHRVIVIISKDLWFREMEVKEGKAKKQNDKETKEHLKTLDLRTKPEATK